MNIADSTKKEVAQLILIGMKKISSDNLKIELANIGYEINPELTFNYINSANGNPYKAKSVCIGILGNKGLSFANINAPRDNIKQLQEIRQNYFVFENGRIWEL